MKPRIDETDLLGWIEGDLAPDRRGLVEQAMREDATLRRRLEAMASDRRALRTWMHGAPGTPRGLVADAIEEAERMALVGVDSAPIRIAWYRNARVLMAAGLLIAVGGAAMIVFVNRPAAPARESDSIAMASTEKMTTFSAPVEAETTMQVASATPADLAPPAVASVPAPEVFPLIEAIERIDRAQVALEDSPRGVLTLPLTSGGRWAQTVGMNSGAKVTSATYSDALRLASVGRLTVRVQGGDTAAIEEALRVFGSTGDHGFEALEQDDFGGVRYAIEMDRTECEFARLVAAIEGASGAGSQAFFDVTLLPAMAARGPGGFDAPRQVSGAAPRVNIQVLVEPGAGVKW